MDREKMIDRLKRVEEAITAKGHPMQDFSTLRMAVLDMIEIMREMIGEERIC